MRDKNLQAERIILLNSQKDLDTLFNVNLDLHLLESQPLKTTPAVKPGIRTPIKPHPTASVKVNSIIAKAKVKPVKR
jgi:hypothetical protein